MKRNKSTIWLIADTHFGHKNLPYISTRPTHYEQLLYKRISEAIKENDILIHLGDFCWGKDEYYHNVFMGIIKGKKWLVRGNHDSKTDNWYLNHGWDYVSEIMYLNQYGCPLILTHRPIVCKYYNIHGHLHENLHREPPPTKKNLLVSMEELDYFPVSLFNFLHKRKII